MSHHKAVLGYSRIAGAYKLYYAYPLILPESGATGTSENLFWREGRDDIGENAIV